MRRIGIGLLILFMALSVPSARAQTSDSGEMLAAGSGDHLWLVRRASKLGDGFQILHHGREPDGPYYRPLSVLPDPPDLLVSWQSRAWFIYLRTALNGREVRREVYSLQVEFHKPTQIWRPLPADHLKKERSLPRVGRLVDVTGTPSGPVALLVPTQRAEASVLGREGSVASDPIIAAPQLLQLQGMDWIELDLPSQARLHAGCFISVMGRRGQGLAIVSPSLETGTARIYLREPAGDWHSFVVTIGSLPIHDVVPVGGQIALIQHDKAVGSWRASYVRAGGLLEIGRFRGDSEAQAFTSLGDQLHRVSRSSNGSLHLTRMDSQSGRVGPVLTLMLQPIPPRAFWQMLITVALVLIILYVVMVMKTDQTRKVNLEPAYVPFPLGMRLLALIIDLAPGGFLVVLVMDIEATRLLQHPLVVVDPTQVVPCLAMLVLTMAHSVCSELLKTTTIGKALLGARVLDLRGGRPTAGQILKRNLFKFFVMLIPPLGVLMFRNRYLRGLPEIKSSTVVAQKHDEASKT